MISVHNKYLAYILFILDTMFLPILIWLILSIFIYIKIPKNYKKIKKSFIVFSLAIFCLIPVYDIVIAKTLGAFYLYSLPKPFLKEKFEKPISLYVEDSFMPFKQNEVRDIGYSYLFSDELDDVNITKVGLNGDDGFVYIYYIDTKNEKYQQFLELKSKIKKIEIEAENSEKYKEGTFGNLIDYYLDEPTLKLYEEIVEKKYRLNDELFKTDKTTKDKLGEFDYTLKINALKLNDFVSKDIHVMTKELINNKTSEQVGYNCIARTLFYYHMFPIIVRMFPKPTIDNKIYESKIKHKIFFDFRLFDY